MSFRFDVANKGCSVDIHHPFEDGHDVKCRLYDKNANHDNFVSLSVTEWIHFQGEASQVMPLPYRPCIRNESTLFLSPSEAVKLRDMLNDAIAQLPPQ